MNRTNQINTLESLEDQLSKVDSGLLKISCDDSQLMIRDLPGNQNSLGTTDKLFDLLKALYRYRSDINIKFEGVGIFLGKFVSLIILNRVEPDRNENRIQSLISFLKSRNPGLYNAIIHETNDPLMEANPFTSCITK